MLTADKIRQAVDDAHYEIGNGGPTYVAVLETARGVTLLHSPDLDLLVETMDEIPHMREQMYVVVTRH